MNFVHIGLLICKKFVPFEAAEQNRRFREPAVEFIVVAVLIAGVWLCCIASIARKTVHLCFRFFCCNFKILEIIEIWSRIASPSEKV